MRGGRNKFGPMYKRDRARKLQIMRQRQIAIQAIRGSMGSDGVSSQLSPIGYSSQPYSNMQIKQEIQIPQVRLKNVCIIFLKNKNLILLLFTGNVNRNFLKKKTKIKLMFKGIITDIITRFFT